MKTNSFYFRAIVWLRGARGLHTSTLPQHVLEQDSSGAARIEGYFPGRARWGLWSYAGFCALFLGAVLMLINVPPMTSANERDLDRAGAGIEVAGVMALVVGEAKRRRDRVRAVIELRAAQSSPATPRSIASLRRTNPDGASWLVSEQELSDDALASAAQHGVTCFVSSDEGVGEVARTRPHRGVSPGSELPEAMTPRDAPTSACQPVEPRIDGLPPPRGGPGHQFDPEIDGQAVAADV